MEVTCQVDTSDVPIGPPSQSRVSCEWSEPVLRYRTTLAEQHVYDKLLAHPNDDDIKDDAKDCRDEKEPSSASI